MILGSTLVMVLCAAILWCAKNQSASLRHLIWRTGFLALAILPVLLVAPKQSLPWLNRGAFAPVEVAEQIDTPKPTADCCTISAEDRPAPANPADPMTPESVIFGVWISGVVLFSLRLIVGLFTLITLRRRASSLFGVVKRANTSAPRSAVAFGVLSPTVLLPRESTEWGSSRRRFVLRHEFAHVRRKDFASNLLAETVCALYWFNPLVWLGARAMRAEAESAADNEVLASGIRASEYASELLRMSADLALSARHTRLVGASPMIQPKIETRLAHLLAPDRTRRGVTTLSSLLLTAGAVFCVVAVAGFRLTERVPQRPKEEVNLALEHMKSLGLATQMYAADYDDVLPFAASTASAKDLVHPYLKSDEAFESPTAGGKFVYNTNLSGRNTHSFTEPSTVPVWIEVLPDPAMGFTTFYLDSHRNLVKSLASGSATGVLRIAHSGNAGKTESWTIWRGDTKVADFPDKTPHDNPNGLASVVSNGLPRGATGADPLVEELVSNREPVIGTQGSERTVVAFFDYECPACRKADPEVQQAIEKSGNTALIYREFPLTHQHKLALPAAMLVSEARFRGKFNAVHQELMSGKKLDQATLDRTRTKFNLGKGSSEAGLKALAKDASLASKLKLNMVPSYVLIQNGKYQVRTTKELLSELK